LDVTVCSSMIMAEHIDCTLCSCAQTVFALKTLTAHGMNAECLHNVFNAIILTKLTLHELDLLVHRTATESKRLYADASIPDFAQRIMLHLQSYATLQMTRRFARVTTLPTYCIDYYHRSL